ncbi:hypothetical protein J6590_041224 [Homalodisca vitripennis]|nr:hypothetical protein J6590_041224 [Homalodisca vitripennis]
MTGYVRQRNVSCVSHGLPLRGISPTIMKTDMATTCSGFAARGCRTLFKSYRGVCVCASSQVQGVSVAMGFYALNAERLSEDRRVTGAAELPPPVRPRSSGWSEEEDWTFIRRYQFNLRGWPWATPAGRPTSPGLDIVAVGHNSLWYLDSTIHRMDMSPSGYRDSTPISRRIIPSYRSNASRADRGSEPGPMVPPEPPEGQSEPVMATPLRTGLPKRHGNRMRHPPGSSPPASPGEAPDPVPRQEQWQKVLNEVLRMSSRRLWLPRNQW